MIRKSKEVIPFGAVAATDLLGFQDAVRSGGMGVQVPAPEAAGGGKGRESDHGVLPGAKANDGTDRGRLSRPFPAKVSR
jgi:hypothetical protein